MDVFLYFYRQSKTKEIFGRFAIAWENSTLLKIFRCSPVRNSFVVRLFISPYKILIFVSRFLLRRGFPIFLKFLLLK